MRLSELEIDPRIRRIVEDQGITELYPPQAEAIAPALSGENLVLAIPTASGKSLVAYLALLKSVLNGGKALYIVPLRALAAEKYEDLKPFEELGIKVALSMGDYDSDDPTLVSYDVIIATSEKADSLLRHRTHWLKQLSVVVADEVHLINDVGRGPTLEVTLAKLRQVNPGAQVIALSATIANSAELARWLEANHVSSEWRPVPLREGVFFDGGITFADLSHRLLDPEGEDIPSLVRDTLRDGGQALVFVNTRRSTESIARKLRPTAKPYLSSQEVKLLSKTAESMEGRQEEPTSLGSRLASDLKAGTAFHHAGLTNRQRKVVEDLFRDHSLKTIVATPTLCLHPDTLITTDRGPVRIADLDEGDRVLTHRGRFRKVLGTTRRPFEGDLVEVKADGMLPVRMSPEHRVLRNTRYRYGYNGKRGHWHKMIRDEPEWVEAKTLCQERRPEFCEEVQSPVEISEMASDGGSVAIRIHDQEFVGRNQFGAEFPHPVARPVPKVIHLSDETAEVFGLYVAEGFTGRNGVVGFAIATYEDDLTELIADSMSKTFRCVPRVSDATRHRRRVYCCSRVLATFLDRQFGRGASNKHFPEVWLSGPLHVLKALVRGAWRGDGSIDPQRYATSRYSTVSPRLAEQMGRMLRRLGYMPSTRVSEPLGFGKRPMYTLALSGAQGRRFLTDIMEVDPELVFKSERTSNWITRVDGSFRSPVRTVRQIPYTGYLYNLHVEGDESYVCSFAFAVHNSAGINLPARRVIIRDVRRYEPNYGYDFIPILEIKQMAGRAGRPQYDEFGEAILLARYEEDIPELMDNYILAGPEAIESKLGSEPALRMHLLAAIATGHVQTERELRAFMERTFYAYQRDVAMMEEGIERVLSFLEQEEMTRREETLRPTLFGRRTSDLYVDPLSAVMLREALKSEKAGDNFSYLHAVAATPDMPTLYLGRKDYAWVEEKAATAEYFVEPEDEEFLLSEVKTATLLEDWMEEIPEDDITKKFRVGPGDIRRIVQMAEWILYAMHELGRLFNKKRLRPLSRLMARMGYGVKEELLDLVSLRSVGRVRARNLFDRGFKTKEDLRSVEVAELARIPTIGAGIAKSILSQLGRRGEEVVEGPREGQYGLYDFD
ncbi:MAG: DEAD/DEAH box helicase [Thermoplasmata archaeon]